MAGAIFGGYLSAVASGTLGAAPGVPPVHAFLGGMLMNLGARIGGGCTRLHFNELIFYIVFFNFFS